MDDSTPADFWWAPACAIGDTHLHEELCRPLGAAQKLTQRSICRIGGRQPLQQVDQRNDNRGHAVLLVRLALRLPTIVVSRPGTETRGVDRRNLHEVQRH